MPEAEMNSISKPDDVSFSAPEGAATEFAAAIEAAIGDAFTPKWDEPMDGEAVKDAMDRLLVTDRPDRGLDILVRAGITEVVLPEVFAMVGFGEGIRHKDVWEHTKKVVRQSPARLNVRWAALLHDIGKVPTRRFESGGQVTFIGHPVVGARMFGRISSRLQFDKALKKSVRFLIAEHLRASAFDETWTDSAVRRFAKDVGEHLDDLLDLSRADITSKYAEKVRRGIRIIDGLEARVREIRALDAKPVPLPKGLGTAIIDHFQVVPGPKLGALMTHLKQEVEAGALGVQMAFDHYIEYIETHRELIADW